MKKSFILITVFIYMSVIRIQKQIQVMINKINVTWGQVTHVTTTDRDVTHTTPDALRATDLPIHPGLGLAQQFSGLITKYLQSLSNTIQYLQLDWWHVFGLTPGKNPHGHPATGDGTQDVLWDEDAIHYTSSLFKFKLKKKQFIWPRCPTEYNNSNLYVKIINII